MGSYINIGMVYSDNNTCRINDDLSSIITHLLQLCDRILVNYPKDDSYENWEEKLFEGKKGLSEAFTILNTKKMSSGKMCCKTHDNEYNIIVSLREDEDVLKGFLFEIPEEELLQDDYSSEHFKKITNNIASRIIELWDDMEFNYAFCDSEADIEYQLCEVEQSEEPIYSMLLVKDNRNHPVIKLSPWCIDGLTQRE